MSAASLQPVDLVAPVTALHFVAPTLLAVGHGPFVELIDTQTAGRLARLEATPANTVHGIRQLTPDTHLPSDLSPPSPAALHPPQTCLLAVFGIRELALLLVAPSSGSDSPSSSPRPPSVSSSASPNPRTGPVPPPLRTSALQLLRRFPALEDRVLDVMLLPASPARVESLTGQPQPASVASTDLLLVAAMAHNFVDIWHIPDPLSSDSKQHGEPHILRRLQSAEHCILYAAALYFTPDARLHLAAGTVFQGVLLWPVAPAVDGDVPVAARCSGHHGVIFSIAVYNEGKSLCSASDDRTLRLWENDTASAAPSATGPAELRCTAILYGHQSRIWDVQALPHGIVSIGEDATCIAWGLDGQLLSSFSGHQGRGIWALAVHPSATFVATGGADGTVRLYPVSPESLALGQPDSFERLEVDMPTSPAQPQPMAEGEDSTAAAAVAAPAGAHDDSSDGDYYRYMGECQGDSLVLVSNTGRIDHFDVAARRFTLLRFDPAFGSHGSVASSSDLPLTVVCNIKGLACLMSLSRSFPDLCWEAHSRGVHFAAFLPSSFAGGVCTLITHAAGELHWWRVDLAPTAESNSPRVKLLARLEPPSQVQSMLPIAELQIILFGSRDGTISAYHVGGVLELEGAPAAPLAPMCELVKAHGRKSVTALHAARLAADRGTFEFYSCGRDGRYCRNRLELSAAPDKAQLLQLSSTRLPAHLGWIERLVLDDAGELLGMCCFAKDEFVIFDLRNNRDAKRINCGGGHRSWVLQEVTGAATARSSSPSLANRMFRYIFLRYKKIHICATLPPPDLSRYACQRVFRRPWQGRECSAMCLTRFRGQALAVTGSETSRLQLHRLCEDGQIAGVLPEAAALAETVRALVADDSNPAQHLLFSGGAKGMLTCWELEQTDVAGSPCPCKMALRARWPRHWLPPFSIECRTMALACLPLSPLGDVSTAYRAVLAAHSDGYVRLLLLDLEVRRFFLVAASDFHDRCVLTVASLTHGGRMLALSGATDGRVACWDFTATLADFIAAYEESKAASAVLRGRQAAKATKGTPSATKETPSAEQPVGMMEDAADDDAVAARAATPNATAPVPFLSFAAHQSGINEVAPVALPSGAADGDDTLGIVSGGDDNALTLTQVRLPANLAEAAVVRMHTVPSAHASSVVGVGTAGAQVLTAGADGRLSQWTLPELAWAGSAWIDVQDVQALAVAPSIGPDSRPMDQYIVAVSGAGLQTYCRQAPPPST